MIKRKFKNKKVVLNKKEPSLTLMDIEVGSHFVLDGVEFVKLCEDHGASFVVTLDTVLGEDTFAFDDCDRGRKRNNFVGSKVEAALNRWLSEHGAIDENVVERPIDLMSMDGMTEYGCPMVRARILTIDEYRRHRRYIPRTSRSYFLATPYTVGNIRICYVSKEGIPDVCTVYDTICAARLTLYLKSNINVY